MVDTLLNEVDADMRAERLANFWQQWRKPIVFLCVAVVVGTASGQLWQHYQTKRGAEWFAQLSVAQKRFADGRVDEAVEEFTAVANTARGDTKTIALLWQGRALLAQSKTEEAKAAFKTASEAKASLWSDLGCLRLAALEAAAAQSCLHATSNSPLKTKRHLWAAAMDAGQGKTAEAKALLAALVADDGLSDAERVQAGQWAASLEPATAKAGQ